MAARKRSWAMSAAFAALLFSAGCWLPRRQEVVVYSALDREFSEPVLQDFERTTQITVLDKYDVESTKTVGLVSQLIQERSRPACDVFWNNEILHTLRLEQQGLLAAYASPRAADFPANYRSPTGHWYGFAARARVLLVNTDLVRPDEQPRSIEDLIDPRWKDRVGIAKPLFGTTATHAAVLFSAWGEERAKAYFLRLKDNARVLAGNKQVAAAVGRGQLAFGWTDTDDAMIEKEQGRPVAIIFPDQQPGGMGTLFIPNTVCVIRGGPHPENARTLIDDLLSPEVEHRLAACPSAQFPIGVRATVKSRAMLAGQVRWMEVDFYAAAQVWETAAVFLRDHFAL